MMTIILESAARTLVLAAAAWAALRILRVRHVVAQKIAWTLVLAAAVAMPFLMRWHWVTLKPVTVPASWTSTSKPSASGPSTSGKSISESDPAHHAAPVEHAAVVAAAQPAPEATIAADAIAPAVIQIAPTLSTPPASRWTVAQLRGLVLPLYLAVCGFLLLRLFFGLALACRVWQRAEHASALVEPRADVRISSDIRTPVTIGLGIVLPASFLNWSRPKLRIVLAHELAHVRQADFYLQLLARLHTAIFWFNPAAWFVQKQLSDLCEAISDYAGIEEAQDAPSYAEVLLEVAAMPRQPLFGVAMARSSRIERRIDRLLVDRLFRRSFVEGKRRALAAAAVIPVALAVSISLVAVRAAAKVTAEPPRTLTAEAPETLPIEPAAVSSKPVSAKPAVRATTPSQPSKAQPAVQAAPPTVTTDHDSDTYYSDAGKDSFMIVDGDKSHMFNYHGDYGAMDDIRKRMHGSYILAERGGKYYTIDDPAMIEESRKLFAPIEDLGRQQEALGAQQEKLGQEQERLGKLQEQAHIETPDMSKEIAQLQEATKKLQDLEKDKTVTQEQLAEVQSGIAGIEGRLGAMQGQIGAKQGDLGRQQGELGAKQGVLGAQQGKLGAEQGRLANEASRKMQVMIDQAFQAGKAKQIQ